MGLHLGTPHDGAELDAAWKFQLTGHQKRILQACTCNGWFKSLAQRFAEMSGDSGQLN